MSLYHDFSTGYPPAKKGAAMSWGEPMHHNKCGGKVVVGSYLGFTCQGCQQTWSTSIMVKFDDDAMACRFHVRTDTTDKTGYILVEREDVLDRRKYLSIVTPEEAAKNGWKKFVY